MRRVCFPVILLVSIMLASVSYATITNVTDEASWQSMVGAWSEVGFEGFLGPVNNQYSGVTFAPFHGGSPYSAAIFPLDGQNSMFTVVPMSAGDGGWAADFTTPVQAVAFWSFGVQSAFSTVQLFDTNNSLLADVGLLASGSGHGAFSYGFNGFVSSSLDISRIQVAISGPDLPAGDAVWFDNFQFSPTPQTAVPEPATLLLFASGLVAVVPFWRFRKG